MAPSMLNYLGFGGREAPPTEEQASVRALPASWYTSQSMLGLERRAIFSRKWMLITHKVRFSQAGDWLKFSVAGYEFVLCRDRKGDINGFHNVCRHRAFPVIQGESGTSKIFSCRYHGWSYGLDGKLAKAPKYEDLPSFDKTQNGLFPIHVRLDVNGFIWVNLDSKNPPEVAWEDDFAGIDTQERFKQYNFDDYILDHSYEMSGAFNWKILADNFNECYHCPTTHPDVPTLADIETHDVDTDHSWIKHQSTLTEAQKRDGLGISSTYYFPNVSLSVLPHFIMLQTFLPSPTDPSSCTMSYQIFRNRHSADADFQLISTMYARIVAEDKVLCELAQRNLNAGVFINGELHPKLEKGPLFFQKVARDEIRKHVKREKAEGREIWPARQRLPEGAKGAEVSREDVAWCEGLACGAGGGGAKEGLAW